MTTDTLERRSAPAASAIRDARHFIGGSFTLGTSGRSWQNRLTLPNGAAQRKKCAALMTNATAWVQLSISKNAQSDG